MLQQFQVGEVSAQLLPKVSVEPILPIACWLGIQDDAGQPIDVKATAILEAQINRIQGQACHVSLVGFAVLKMVPPLVCFEIARMHGLYLARKPNPYWYANCHGSISICPIDQGVSWRTANSLRAGSSNVNKPTA